MKKISILFVVFALAVVSCHKKEKRTITNADGSLVEVPNNSQKYVDRSEIYEGTFPCASCPGIKMELKLGKDETYELVEEYLGEKGGKFKSKGKIEFSSNRSYVTLKNDRDSVKDRIFIVEGDDLYQVAEFGERDLKQEYKLTKK